jgi:hypothetical protein
VLHLQARRQQLALDRPVLVLLGPQRLDPGAIEREQLARRQAGGEREPG